MKYTKQIQNSVKDRSHRMFLKGLVIGIISLIALVVLAGNSPHLKAVGDALFIDEKGNVGIGTNEPKDALDVNGKVRAHELEIEGNINSAGTVKAKKIELDGSELTVALESIKLFLVPKRGIIAWFPKPEDQQGNGLKAPDGWAICDGSDGTPDLTDRFIRGTGSAKEVGKTGGTEEHNHNGKTGPPSGHFKKGSTIGSRWSAPVTGHFHSIKADSNLPPYIVLVYIMKL
jgi:hypothetical protein